MSKIWVEHAEDMVRVLRALETFEKAIPEHDKSDLEYDISVKITCYGDPSGFSFVKEDDTWYLEVESD